MRNELENKKEDDNEMFSFCEIEGEEVKEFNDRLENKIVDARTSAMSNEQKKYFELIKSGDMSTL